GCCRLRVTVSLRCIDSRTRCVHQSAECNRTLVLRVLPNESLEERTLKARATALLALFSTIAAGCGGGGSAGVPTPTQPPLQPDKLQLAVGTANVFGGGTGLNVVTTFRAPNGDSATLANTPILTGPSGFTVPATFPGAYGGTSSDAGTNHISGSPQVNLSVTPPNTILGTFTG